MVQMLELQGKYSSLIKSTAEGAVTLFIRHNNANTGDGGSSMRSDIQI